MAADYMLLLPLLSANLAERLHSEGWRPGWGGVGEAALHLARGLAHLHSCGILHRDIKPANVLTGRLLLLRSFMPCGRTQVKGGCHCLGRQLRKKGYWRLAVVIVCVTWVSITASQHVRAHNGLQSIT